MRWIGAIALMCICGLAWAGGTAQETPAPDFSRQGGVRLAAVHESHTYLLHLPGIAGARGMDRLMLSGLRDGGFTGEIETYDWTEHDPGLNALMAYQRNQTEAQKIADKLTKKFRADPTLHIVITSHSGGTGLAVWALEKLPPDVKVDRVLLLSSALSPQYDLTKALSHVRGKIYSFFSENDVLVLGAGTKLFGTIDGVRTESAGEVGFIMPPDADFQQYQKLVQKPYEKSWMEYGNIGDHIGPMHRAFSMHILAPLVIGQSAAPTAKAENVPAQAGTASNRHAKS